MGSRAVVVVCRDGDVGPRRFGSAGDGAIFTRTGRAFFNDADLQAAMLARVRGGFDELALWDELATDWAVLDCELLPWSGRSFPWATFVVNVSGALALGVLMVLVLEVWRPHRYVRPFVGIGLLGGWTTFSTYALEARDLLAVGRPATALAYVAGSLVVGLLAVWLGMLAARRLGPAPRREVPR